MSDRLLHTKVSKKKPLNYFPKKEDGHDGDMQIVSIKGKGTYLCVKDKSEWKISEKFNPRNKFDTHIFDEITTKKIKSSGGLAVTILSKEVSFGEDIGKTFTNATDVKQPILEIGDGLNTGVISSHGSRTLLLKTGDTNTYNSWIAVLKGGGITANVEHTKPYNIMFNSSGTGAGKLRVKNRNTDGGNASLSFIVNHTNSDGFVKYKYTDASDASNDIQWVHGFDGSDSDTFKLNYVSGDSDSTVCTPSNGNTRFSVTSAGNATISSDLTVTGGNMVLGSDLDGNDKTITFGHSTLKTIMGIDDSADAFVINTDAAFDGTLANNSFSIDASHNVIVAGTLTSSAGVCGGPKVTNHVTNDADDTMAGALTISKEGTQLKLEYNANDYATLAVADTGDLTIATVGDGTTDSDLTLDADVDIFLDAVCDSTKGIKLKNQGTLFAYFDIHHASSHLKIFENGGASTNDYFDIAVYANGATTLHTNDNGGATAHLKIDIDGHVEFDDCGVGFDLVTPTYNALDTDVDFRQGNKQFVTFDGNNIADLNLIFPAVSGNFTLLLKQDGTGSRIIAADGYLVFESDGTAASGSSTVKFAGGSNPTLTTDANHVDILSFFWDADNQICYGVATLDFQF